MPSFFDQTSLTRLVTWIAWILLHTVWQGAVIGAFLWVVMRTVYATQSTLRYCLACVALIAMMLAPAATGIMLRGQLRHESAASTISEPALFHHEPQFATRYEILSEPRNLTDSVDDFQTRPTATSSNRVSSVNGILSWRSFRNMVNRYSGCLVALWLLGVTVFTTRLLSSFRAIRILRKSGTPVTESALLKTFTSLIERIHLGPRIPLMESAVVCVPTVLGWLRPVILLPLACSSGLSLDQIEALLAHELAHIKRHDYLINVLQSFVETVLFYHPAVWWISNTIRYEREHCCDAMALRLISDRNIYANSLIALAQLATASRLSLSARGGNLKHRIQRILNVPTSAAPASGPVIALTLTFLLTFLMIASWLSKASADDPKFEQPVAAKSEKEEPNTPPSESKPALSETKEAKDVTPQDTARSPEANPQKRRRPNGGGFGGAEMFNVLDFEIVQKELELSEDALSLIMEISGTYRKEIQSTLPLPATRPRTIEGGQVQEATREAMPVFKAAVAKFRPQLKQALNADQYTRLRQITWHDMGTAAFADDELIEALKITKDQQDKMSAIDEEYDVKRRKIMAPNVRPAIRRPNWQALSKEQDTKITELLSNELLLDKFSTLKGKAFDLNELRNRRFLSVFASGRAARLLHLVEYPAVRKDIGISDDDADKINKLTREFRGSIVEIERSDAAALSAQEREKEMKRIDDANHAASSNSLAKLKEILSADQFTRLQQIRWQDQGTNALLDLEMIKALPVSDELLEKIKAVFKEYDDKRDKDVASAGDFRRTLVELNNEQEMKIDETLTREQLDQFARLLGKDFALTKARRERVEASEALRADRRNRYVQRRRPLITLAENIAVQKELEVGAEAAEKLKSLGEEIRTAIRNAIGDPPNFQATAPEQRNKMRDEILKTDQAMTEKFLPKLKEILTAGQFIRLKQIHWQRRLGLVLQETEVVDALSLSKEQQERIQAIDSEWTKQRDEIIDSVNIDTISGTGVRTGNSADEIRAWLEQNRTKFNEVLTKEQQENLATLRGKEFDVRRLRP